MAFLSRQALRRLGFAAIGVNVLVSDKASIHGASRIALGNHVRIDDFCVLSAGEGGIRIGSYVHVACQCTLIGKGRIELEDFSNLFNHGSPDLVKVSCFIRICYFLTRLKRVDGGSINRLRQFILPSLFNGCEFMPEDISGQLFNHSFPSSG